MAAVRTKGGPSRAERRKVMLEKLGAAVRALLEEGETYGTISVERLVAEAGISRSGFYIQFEDKGDLILALTDDVAGQLMIAADPWWALDRPSREELIEALRSVVGVYTTHSTMWQAIVDGSADDPRLRERLDLAMEAGITGAARHIRVAQAAGAVASDVDPERTAGWLIWMIERGLSELVRGAPASEEEALVEALARIIAKGLYESCMTDAILGGEAVERDRHGP